VLYETILISVKQLQICTKSSTLNLLAPPFFPDLIRALEPVFLQDASLGRD